MGLLITTYANLVNVWKTSGKAGKQRVKDTEPSVYPDTLTSEQRMFLSSLEVDEDELNKIEMETREQVGSERWREERRFRFTASRFHVISKRQRNHDTFAKQLIYPNEFTSRHTAHGRKYEATAIQLLEEELLRILKFEKKLTKVTGVEVLLHAWRSQFEKLKEFLSQRFSLTRDEATGTQVLSKATFVTTVLIHN